MLRNTLKFIINFLFTLLTRVEVEGVEHLPVSGGFILCSNHLSILDAPLLFSILEREDVTGFVAKKHRRNLFFRFLVSIVDGIWLNREEADTQAMRAARDYLKQGGGLGVAPEGTRSDTNTLISAKTGAVYLANTASVPIFPVAISGTEQAFEELKHFRRPQLNVNIGKPITLPPIGRQERDLILERYTDEIMCRIAAMLPPRYHGVYADHPRLKHILAEDK